MSKFIEKVLKEDVIGLSEEVDTHIRAIIEATFGGAKYKGKPNPNARHTKAYAEDEYDYWETEAEYQADLGADKISAGKKGAEKNFRNARRAKSAKMAANRVYKLAKEEVNEGKYHWLLTRDGDDKPWNPQFGDYDKETVKAESESYHDYKSRHKKVVSVPGAHKKHLDNLLTSLNGVKEDTINELSRKTLQRYKQAAEWEANDASYKAIKSNMNANLPGPDKHLFAADRKKFRDKEEKRWRGIKMANKKLATKEETEVNEISSYMKVMMGIRNKKRKPMDKKAFADKVDAVMNYQKSLDARDKKMGLKTLKVKGYNEETDLDEWNTVGDLLHKANRHQSAGRALINTGKWDKKTNRKFFQHMKARDTAQRLLKMTDSEYTGKFGRKRKKDY